MRARNIKPGLFENEILAVADPMLSLLFQGLWLLADREGRLEDRPLRFKAKLFPLRETYTTASLNRHLDELHAEGFIVRYQAGSKKIIQINNFLKHQRPHQNEAPSAFPPPSVDSGEGLVPLDEVKVDHGAPKARSTRAESLNPESLNPESLNAENAASAAPPTASPESRQPGKPNGPDVGWIARLWWNRLRRAKNKHDEPAAEVFAEMIRHGVSFDAIKAGIENDARDRTEQIWDFQKRLMPSTGPPGRQSGGKTKLSREERRRVANDDG